MTDSNGATGQAEMIAQLLPKLMGRLFTLERDPAENLPLAQLRVCRVLYYGGARPMSAISREMGVSLSAITQLADRLERSHLVERVATGADRRIRHLRLTPRGEKMMRHREEARVRRVTAVLEHLSEAERTQVISVLEMILRVSVKMNAVDGDERIEKADRAHRTGAAKDRSASKTSLSRTIG